MKKSKNRNIVLLKDIADLKDELDYNKFKYKKFFFHLCNLIPYSKEERLDIEVINEKFIKNEGLVYVFVIQSKIFKIGNTITSIIKRIQSYNCGKVEYRIAGTNSTTNYFVLQSLSKINKKVKVFAFFPEQPKYTIFGKVYQDSFSPSKRAEKIILNDFVKEYKRKPIGCSQV